MGEQMIRILVNVANEAAPYLDAWLDAAHAAAAAAPTTGVDRILRGADTIELPVSQAHDLRRWAATLNGWHRAPDHLKPLRCEVIGGGAWFAPIE
jgi:hypothetical protein